VARLIWKLGLAVFLVFGICISASATATATLAVTGVETQRQDRSWDIGPLLITISEPNYTFVESIYYGQYSTPASVASQISGAFTRDYLQNGLCATASVVNSVATVTFKLRGTATFGTLRVTGPITSFQLQGSGFSAVNWTPPGSSGGTSNTTVYMTGGVDHGTFYDSGTVFAQVSGAQVSVDWSEGSTTSSLASEMAAAINAAAGGFVSASASGATVSVTTLIGGPAADTSISSSVTDSNSPYFSTPSFSISTANMTGGAATEGSLLYSYTIPDQGGHDVNGNLLSVSDSVMGQWIYGYDNLNRLVTGSAVTSSAPGIPNTFAGVLPSWNYDAIGNRTAETWGGTGNATVPTSSTMAFAQPNNQVSSSSMGTPTYDAAGEVIADSLNSYLYDAEGRLCAVKNSTGAMTGYIYEAGGIRVAKGSLTSFSCNFSSNGYQTTTSWVLGPAGEQVTEYAVSGGTSTWVHTNAFAGGQLLATYHDGDTYFDLNDWLGTKRAEAGAGGCFTSFTSMPFADGLTTVSGSNPCADTTEHHFTGKERDSESGNDYFGARYYASSMGRFLSPDWASKIEPVPYAKLDDPQSLNLYSYVRNNPLSRVDADGHVDWGIQRAWNWLQGKGFKTDAQIQGLTVAQTAHSNLNSLDWMAAPGGTSGRQLFKPGSNKCNEYVGDTLDQSGHKAPMVPDGKGGMRLATAHELADPNVHIAGLSDTKPMSQAQVGDVISQAHGDTEGHTGIIVAPGLTSSANANEGGVVTENNWGFRDPNAAINNGERNGSNSPAPVVRTPIDQPQQ